VYGVEEGRSSILARARWRWRARAPARARPRPPATPAPGAKATATLAQKIFVVWAFRISGPQRENFCIFDLCLELWQAELLSRL